MAMRSLFTLTAALMRFQGGRGLLADLGAAKRWYQKAINRGDAEPRERLHKLLHVVEGDLDR
jgi:TPR repeat protein